MELCVGVPHPWLNLSSVLYVVSVIVCCSFTRVGMTVRSAALRGRVLAARLGVATLVLTSYL